MFEEAYCIKPKKEPIEADLKIKNRFKFENSKEWPYKDFSFEEWDKNGRLITREGLPSKLDRECYDLVRTEEFKEWFGDWESQKDNEVSKMIDPDTSEPKVFYRGDKSLYRDGFLVKPEEERTIKSDEKNYAEKVAVAHSRNQGVFFTNNKQVALEYGSDLDAVTLGLYGVDSETDHPKTFSKIRNWLESFASSDLNFWNKVLDKYICNKYSSELTDASYKRNFEHFFNSHDFSKKDIESLWNELRYNRREKDPGYYIDIFLEKGLFDTLIKGFMTQSFNNPNRKFNTASYCKFGSTDSPKWSQQFKKLSLEYFSEPLVLSTVFINSKNPKTMESVDIDGGYDIYNARIDGHDSFIHKNGVGKYMQGVKDRADEIIVFQTENIWTVKKESLSDRLLN